MKGRTDRMGGVADAAEPQWPETRRGYPHHKRENRKKIEIRERGVCVCCRCDCIERRAAPTNAAVAGERAKNKRLNHIRFSSIDCRCCAGIALDAGLDGLFSSSSSSFTTAKVYFILRGALALFQRG